MQAMAGFASRLINAFREKDSFNTSQHSTVRRLVSSRKALPGDAGSEDGLAACGSFLEDLTQAAKILGVQPAPRSYRTKFTPNYRAIFPDETRSYRVDVLEGCLDSPASIWVNGEQFELGPTTLSCADGLRSAWADLISVLDRWDNAQRVPSASTPSQSPGRQDISDAIKTFDHAWANLEHKYIEELIRIESQARSLVVEAIGFEKKLSVLEAQRPAPDDEVYVQARKDLVQSFGHLNAVSNHRRKGRDDLTADILTAAVRVTRKFGSASTSNGGANKGAFVAAQFLAGDVVKSFEALRLYLREVEGQLECIDPHLCNNAGLVERLVDWEESWEVGNRYLTNEKSLNTLCDLVDSTQQLQAVEPKLTAMCEDCDVELFLVLPRLLILRSMLFPEHQELLQSLLPHRFQPSSSSSSATPGVELAEFASSLTRTRQAAAAQHAVADTGAGAWEFFARSALGTPGEAVPGAVEGFMRELEKWSVEVQRHCAEDWNQCCAVLVHCLSNSVREQKQRVLIHEI